VAAVAVAVEMQDLEPKDLEDLEDQELLLFQYRHQDIAQ
jgi:hypothetical protein